MASHDGVDDGVDHEDINQHQTTRATISKKENEQEFCAQDTSKADVISGQLPVQRYEPSPQPHRSVRVIGSQNATFLGPVTGVTVNVIQQIPGTEEDVKSKELQLQLANQAADSCQLAIKTRYMTTGSYVKMIPWVDDDTKHITDIYTKTRLINCNERKGLRKGKAKLEDFHDIFHSKTRQGLPIKRAVLNGLAGLGKSTLLDKFAYDWADESFDSPLKFKLVFLLKMHALCQQSDVIDSVFDQLLDQDTHIDKGSLKLFIDQNPERVLILLDGFDECMTSNLGPIKPSFGSIHKILNRQICRECYVVVSTRPSHLDKLLSNCLIQSPFIHMKILGFAAEDIKAYLDKFYSEDLVKARNILLSIQSSSILLCLATRPMLLLLICLLWREDSNLLDTMSQLYTEALRYIFRRKHNVPPEEVAKILLELGKIGLRGLLAQELSFKETEFSESSILTISIRVGILTSQRVLRGLDTHNSIQFIHKSFQELCAAKYFQSLAESDSVQFQLILDQICMHKNPCHYEYFLRFCCGNHKACTDAILQALHNKLSSRFRVLELALDCYYEGQSHNLPSVDFVNLIVSHTITIGHYNSSCLTSFIYFLKHVFDHQIQDKEGGDANYLDRVNCMRISGCNLHRFSADLAYSMRGMTSLRVLILSSCSLTASEMINITSAFCTRPNLTELDLANNRGLGGSVAMWASNLGQMKGLMVLKVTDCGLVGEDVKHIVASLSDISELVLASNKSIGGSAASWAPHLRQLKSLQELNFRRCGLTTQDLTCVAASLCHVGSIVLNLSFNEALGGLGAVWAPCLQKIKHLRKLNLRTCGVTGEDVKHVAMAGQTVSILDLSYNMLLGGSCESWASYLQYMEGLQRLYMPMCFLLGEDAHHLTSALCSLPGLIELDLSQNKTLSGSCSTWCFHLQEMKQLEKLDLSSCSFTDDDVKHVVVSVCQPPRLVDVNLSQNKALGSLEEFWSSPMPHLQKVHLGSCSLSRDAMFYISLGLSRVPGLIDLDLSYNKSLGGSGKVWGSLLQQLEQLQNLNLTWCSLTGEDVQYIAGNLPSLLNLHLSYNRALGGCGSLWAPHLQQLTHLEWLDLSECSITGGDMKHVATAFQNMSSLVEVNLSGNITLSTLAGCVNSWCHLLPQMKYLQRLDLSLCLLTCEDIEQIAISLSQMPAMVEVYMSGNRTWSGSSALWSPSVAEHEPL